MLPCVDAYSLGRRRCSRSELEHDVVVSVHLRRRPVARIVTCAAENTVVKHRCVLQDGLEAAHLCSLDEENPGADPLRLAARLPGRHRRGKRHRDPTGIERR